MVEKLVPDPFLKNKNWAYLLISGLKFVKVCFIAWQVEGYRNRLKLSCRPLAFTHIKLFYKIKRCLELVSLPDFLHNFWRKTFLLLYSINWPNFIVWLHLLCEILGNMCIAIVCKPGCDIMNFGVNLIFLIKPFFRHDPVMTKT